MLQSVLMNPLLSKSSRNFMQVTTTRVIFHHGLEMSI